METVKRRTRRWLPSLTLLAAACLPGQHGVHASTPHAIEAELLSGARLWASKNRPDMARQLVDKLLAMDPNSAEGLATLGDLALREKKLPRLSALWPPCVHATPVMYWPRNWKP